VGRRCGGCVAARGGRAAGRETSDHWIARLGHGCGAEQLDRGLRATAALAAIEIRRADDIDSAFQGLQLHAQALYVPAVPLFFANRARINSLALAARLPTMHLVREYVEAGDLMSYGPNWPDMWRHAADLVDKILRGAKPADIPVQQPTKFDLVVNLTTAKALGLKIPDKLLALADEVIE
jgi:putative tryptophan/tyrosine transport system substrate-binding protein